MWRIVVFAALLSTAVAARGGAEECVDCTPLTDLGPEMYLGIYQGGLYPGGANEPPASHRRDARQAAGEIVPRGVTGAPQADGRIGSIALSISNVNQEFSVYERNADRDAARNARVAVLNLGEGGQGLDLISDPTADYWQNVDLRLAAAGLGAEQIQVAWLKLAVAEPSTFAFPDHALLAIEDAVDVVQLLKARFPNLSLCFLSSRIYGGYSLEPDYGEPLSYETGFAVKWLIERQIEGDPELNHDPDRGPVTAPVLVWGPYLWADGATPRSDGLTWLEEDMEADGAHPSALGEAKVAAALDQHYSSSAFSRSWYRRRPGSRLVAFDTVADATVSAAAADTNFGSETLLRLRQSSQSSYLKFDLRGVGMPVERAKLSFMTPSSTGAEAGTTAIFVSDSSWQEASITFDNAPPPDGASFGVLSLLSRGAATSIDVTSAVQEAAGDFVSFALSIDPGETGARAAYLSREGGEPPRLVLTLGSP